MKKKLIKIAIALGILILLAAIGFLIWYLIRDTPSKIVMQAAEAAQIGDEDKFKAFFSKESVQELENSWKLSSTSRYRGGWKMMMAGILTRDELLPEVVQEEIAEPDEKAGEDAVSTAKVVVEIDGVKRTVTLVQEDGDWRIDVITKVDLEAAKNAVISPGGGSSSEEERPENEMWWEDE